MIFNPVHASAFHCRACWDYSTDTGYFPSLVSRTMDLQLGPRNRRFYWRRQPELGAKLKWWSHSSLRDQSCAKHVYCHCERSIAKAVDLPVIATRRRSNLWVVVIGNAMVGGVVRESRGISLWRGPGGAPQLYLSPLSLRRGGQGVR